MEKAGLLIERLLDQYRNKAGNDQMRITAQLLLCELEKMQEEEISEEKTVSVIFPSVSNFNISDVPPVETVLQEEKQQQAEVIAEIDTTPTLKQDNTRQSFSFFDPMTETPTLALKQQEVNETIAARQENPNNKLKLGQKEVAHNLKDGPIKDLRKGIGVNDQYRFINELFRGDQTMYERSIKTINGFNVYGEAELWIKRELKLKLGWKENSDEVLLFDQLIKRRFA